jgi:excisionase family DNA binding protein
MQTRAESKTKTKAKTTAKINGDRPLINVGKAAAYLGVSAASLRKWSDGGQVTFYRTPGGQRRYSRADLEEFIRSMRQPSRPAGSPAGNERNGARSEAHSRG